MFAGSGMRTMQLEHALEALGRLLTCDLPEVVVASVDWATFKAVYEAKRRRPLLDRIVVARPAHQLDGDADVLRQLEAAGAEERLELLSVHVRAAAASVLGLASEQIDIDKGLFDLGMDSLMSVELKTRLQQSLQRVLPTTLAFKYPTVRALVDFLASELFVRQPMCASAADPAPARVPRRTAAAHDLSEDDLATLLLEKLEQIR